jgi:hypothetical protein
MKATITNSILLDYGTSLRKRRNSIVLLVFASIHAKTAVRVGGVAVLIEPLVGLQTHPKILLMGSVRNPFLIA